MRPVAQLDFAQRKVADDGNGGLLPELPALSISIGMNAVSSTAPESSVSKWVMMVEVNVAEIISSISHGRRCATRLQTLVFI